LPAGLVLRLRLLVRTVAAVGAACGGTHQTVTGAACGGTHQTVTSIVASDATGDGSFYAALGVCGRCRDKHEYGRSECDQGFHDAIPPGNTAIRSMLHANMRH
jgi:hypothetical protein